MVANRARREWEEVALKWRKEVKDLEASLALIHNADMRAIKRWQAEKPGRDLMWPDRTEMILWLLQRLPENSEPSTM